MCQYAVDVRTYQIVGITYVNGTMIKISNIYASPSRAATFKEFTSMNSRAAEQIAGMAKETYDDYAKTRKVNHKVPG